MGYTSEAKQQSRQWHHSGSPPTPITNGDEVRAADTHFLNELAGDFFDLGIQKQDLID